MNINPVQPLCFVFGTRPEIIKLSPIIKECQRKRIPFIAIHTGQHYSENMDAIFWKQLELPELNYNLHVGSGTHGEQTGQMLKKIEKVLVKEKPQMVFVQGDTNSVLAGSLAAAKLKIPIGHVEAGLRSYDRRMPEEINRVLAGAVATWHFAPTEDAKNNLLKEGITSTQIYVTGNTIVDAVIENSKIAKERSNILQELSIVNTPYALVTIHRPENADSKINMTNILTALNKVAEKQDLELVWPIHPRTKKQIEKFDLHEYIHSNVKLKLIDPIGFFDMMKLLSNSQLAITDSGGIQEEACILKIPCVTIRRNTERPESVAVGANLLSKSSPEEVLDAVAKMLKSDRKWQNPFGDGRAAEKIVSIIENQFDSNFSLLVN